MIITHYSKNLNISYEDFAAIKKLYLITQNKNTFTRYNLIKRKMHLNNIKPEANTLFQMEKNVSSDKTNEFLNKDTSNSKIERSRKTLTLKVAELVEKIQIFKKQGLSRGKILKRLNLYKPYNRQPLLLVEYLFEDTNLVSKSKSSNVEPDVNTSFQIKETLLNSNMSEFLNKDNSKIEEEGRPKKPLTLKVAGLVEKIKIFKKEGFSRSKILEKLNLYKPYNREALLLVEYLFEDVKTINPSDLENKKKTRTKRLLTVRVADFVKKIEDLKVQGLSKTKILSKLSLYKSRNAEILEQIRYLFNDYKY